MARRFEARTQRRKTNWLSGPGGVLTQISASGAQAFATTSAQTLTGSTLVRCRGYLNLFLSSVGSAGDGFHGAFGIGIANENALSAGIASLMAPVTDVDWEGWLYHTFLSVRTNQAAEATLNSATFFQMHVDSKAMRKLPSNMAMYAAIEVTEIGTVVLQGDFFSRILVKQP